ncbi:MAG: hypothetical protein IJT95_05320 [Abditibacteriota bacterium]|nr:hypothetical protein [Abditibacteriota bacterium]
MITKLIVCCAACLLLQSVVFAGEGGYSLYLADMLFPAGKPAEAARVRVVRDFSPGCTKFGSRCAGGPCQLGAKPTRGASAPIRLPRYWYLPSSR